MDTSKLISSAIEGILTPTTKLSDILLKVRTISHFLKNEELKEWTANELNGYLNQGVAIPEYRRIRVAPRVNLIHEYFSVNKGYQPNMEMVTEMMSEEEQLALNYRLISNGVSEVEHMADAETGMMPIPWNLYIRVSRRVYEPTGWHIHKAWQIIPSAQLHGILSTIRTKLLDTLLQLDALGDNIFIPSLQNQPQVQKKIEQALHSITAPNGVVNINYAENNQQTTSTGNAAQLNIAQGDNTTQSINGSEVSSLKELVTQIKEAFAAESIFDNQREEISGELERIEVQLKKSEPKKGVVKSSIESLQDLAKESVGSVGAHVIFELLHQAYLFVHQAS
jgi:hypothetical protein